jgi:hypothetical protein
MEKNKTIITQSRAFSIEEKLKNFTYKIERNSEGNINRLLFKGITITDSFACSSVKGLKDEMNFEDIEIIHDLILLIKEENYYHENNRYISKSS